MKRDQLDQLLAGGYLSGAQYDDIERKVLARVAPRKLPWKAAAVLVPVFSAAAVIVAILSFRVPEPEFRSKGGALTNTAALDIACGPSGGRVCASGSTLLFTANAALTSGYLGAYAERIDSKDASRIWYFPDVSGNAPRIEPGPSTVVLPRGVLIGADHTPGRYRVTVWTSPTPMSRAQSAASGLPRASFEIDVY